MAEIGFAASVLTLINAALFTVKEIQKVHHRVSGTSASLDNISKQLNTLERSLSLIRNETSLQNQDGIEQQIQSVINLSTELKGFHDHLSLVYQRSSTSQFVHALRSGSREERYLEGILKRLDTANNDLTMRILIAQVGVVRYFQGGFRVAYNVLEQINARVKQVLGMNLALLELVRNREQWFDGTVHVGATELGSLEATYIQATNGAARNSIYGNIGVGNVMTGNVGVGSNYRAAPRTNAIKQRLWWGRPSNDGRH